MLIKNNSKEDAEDSILRDKIVRSLNKAKANHVVQWITAAFVVTVIVASLTSTARASFFSIFDRSQDSNNKVSLFYDEPNSQSVILLQAARNIDPKPSKGGGDVKSTDGALVFDSTPFSSLATDQLAPEASDQISLYLVQEGDTLSQVAEMFSVSVNTIVWANGLSSTRDIHPGETLLILPVTGVQHTVKKGDTLASIAKKYGGDKDEIASYNNLTGDTLTAGDVITVPGGEIEEVRYTSTNSGTKVVTSGPNVSGYFIHPLPGAVRTQGIHGYNGVDFGAGAGTPIRAAAGGRVIVSRVGGWNGGYGNFVVIEHSNGTQTLYAHNSKNSVWQGQNVVQGQVIGYVGSTGRSTGTHLHFEVRGARNPF